MDTEPIEAKGVSAGPRDVLFKNLPPILSPKRCIQMVKDKEIMSQLQLAMDVKGGKGDIEPCLFFR